MRKSEIPLWRVSVGDCFLVSLAEEDCWCVGQIIDFTSQALNSLVCVFFNIIVTDPDEALLNLDQILNGEILLTVPVLAATIDWKTWKILDSRMPVLRSSLFLCFKELEYFADTSFYNANVVEEMLKLYFNLLPKTDYLNLRGELPVLRLHQTKQ